jgi:transcriptional regulator with XRE-family HTH domain
MTKMDDSLPNFLRAWRKRNRMTQEVLAEKAGFTPGAISQFETGTINFTVPSLIALAAVLNCRPGDILSYSPSEIAGQADPDARIRSLLLSLGVEARELDRATNIILTFLPKKGEALSEQSPTDGQSQPASRRREEAPLRRQPQRSSVE